MDSYDELLKNSSDLEKTDEADLKHIIHSIPLSAQKNEDIDKHRKICKECKKRVDDLKIEIPYFDYAVLELVVDHSDKNNQISFKAFLDSLEKTQIANNIEQNYAKYLDYLEHRIKGKDEKINRDLYVKTCCRIMKNNNGFNADNNNKSFGEQFFERFNYYVPIMPLHPIIWNRILNFRKASNQDSIKNSKRMFRLTIFAYLLFFIFVFFIVFVVIRYMKNNNKIKISLAENDYFKNNTLELVYGDNINEKLENIVVIENSPTTTKPTMEFEYSNFDSEVVKETQDVKLTISISYGGILNNYSKKMNIKINVSPKQLDYITSFENKGNEIKWNSISDCNAYVITVVNSNITSTITSNSNSLGYLELKNRGIFGDTSITVKAKSSNNKYLDSDDSTAFSFYMLEEVEGINYDNGSIKWDAVTGAEYYELYVNGVVIENKLDNNSFDYSFTSNNNTVSVVPHRTTNHLYKKITEDVVFLNSVDNILVDGDYIVWDSIDNASSYDVFVNGAKSVCSTNKLYIKEYDEGIYDVEVVSKGNIPYYDSKASSFKVLVNYTLSIDSAVVSWNLMDGDYVYNLFVDSEKIFSSKTINSYDLATVLTTGTHNIYVGIEDSNILDFGRSNEISVTKLSNPIISIENELLSVDDESKIVEYYLDGVEFDGSLIGVTAGTHSVKAKYISNSDYEISSDLSNALSITKLASPIVSIQNELIKVDDNTKQVKYYLDGNEFNGVLANISVGAHNIKARYIPSKNNELTSELSDMVSVTKLASPNISIQNGEIIVDDSTKEVKYYLDGSLFDGVLNNISAGTHSIKAKYIPSSNSEITSELSNAISVTKLSNPIISVQNELIKVDDTTKTVKYYLDSVEFDGDLSKISAGSHSICAKYLSSSDDEIDSNMSESISVVKLESPVLTIQNENIYVDDSTKIVKYYLDDVEFDGVLSNMTTGTHYIKAKYVPRSNNEISSELSEAISVVKLDNPVLELGVEEIICSANNINLVYYLDGEVFNGNYSSIPLGTHIVKAKNLASKDNEISSNYSNELEVFKADVSINYSQISSNRIRIKVTSNESETLDYDVNIKYYYEGDLIDTSLKQNYTESEYTTIYQRNGTVSTQLDILITFRVGDKVEVFRKIFDIE